MELYVKCGIKQHVEVPFSFGVRTAGASKLSSKVIGQYLNHLSQLYRYRYPAQTLLVLLLIVLVLFVFVRRFLL
jgi:dolichol-phosphate mannosyltransferase